MMKEKNGSTQQSGGQQTGQSELGLGGKVNTWRPQRRQEQAYDLFSRTAILPRRALNTTFFQFGISHAQTVHTYHEE